METMETEITDLFEHYHELPQPMLDIINKYEILFEDGETDLYALCKEMLKETELIGYTFDYGLSGEPYDLRLLTTNI